MRPNGIPKPSSKRPDRIQAALESDLNAHVESFEERRSLHEGKIDGKQRAYNTMVEHSLKEADRTEQIEGGRIEALRVQRADLDREITAYLDVVGLAFSMMNRPFIPGTTTINELYDIDPLSRTDAAKRAGLASSTTHKIEGIKFLKWAGMAGCLILSTFGMGAVILMKTPQSLLMNPIFLAFAIGLAFTVIGGTYLTIQPTWRNLGSKSALHPDDPATKRAMRNGGLMLVATLIVVATIDAKAIMSLTATRAMVNVHAAPSELTAWMAAFALSAAYVAGASIAAFHEAYNIEVEAAIAAEIEKDAALQKQELNRFVQVRNAVEAYNKLQMAEARRGKLTAEIAAIEEDLKKARIANYEAIPEAPELAEEHKADLRAIKGRAQFAAAKTQAHESLAAKDLGAGK